MSFELALSIASITNRILIIPPTQWCNEIDRGKPKEEWSNIWDVCDIDKAKEHFEIINLFELQDFKSHHTLLQSHHWRYTEYIDQVTSDLYHFTNKDQPERILNLINNSYCLVNGTVETPDFREFAGTRTIIDLDRHEKFICFTDNLFGHFWYMVYPGDSDQRNQLKHKVNQSLQYKEQYYNLAKDLAPPLTYNAIHLRNSEFMSDWPGIEKLDTANKIYRSIRQCLSPDLPLYVATDITDINLFSQVKDEFNVIFCNDLTDRYTELERAVLDQIICSNAVNFFGTYLSTFTKRINIMRGLKNRQTSDYMGLNKIENNMQESKNLLPWIDHGYHWPWHWSSYVQWNYE